MAGVFLRCAGTLDSRKDTNETWISELEKEKKTKKRKKRKKKKMEMLLEWNQKKRVHLFYLQPMSIALRA